MKVNVASIAQVHSTSPTTPTAYALLLKDVVGKSVVPDVPDTTLVSEFTSLLIISFGFNALTASYSVEKNKVALDPTKTLKQCGVVENDNLKLRVILNI
jgi:hypothetical protein